MHTSHHIHRAIARDIETRRIAQARTFRLARLVRRRSSVEAAAAPAPRSLPSPAPRLADAPEQSAS